MTNEPMPTAEALQHVRGMAANADCGLVQLTDMQRAAVALAAAVERVQGMCAREADRNEELGLPLRPALYVDEIRDLIDASPKLVGR